ENTNPRTKDERATPVRPEGGVALQGTITLFLPLSLPHRTSPVGPARTSPGHRTGCGLTAFEETGDRGVRRGATETATTSLLPSSTTPTTPRRQTAGPRPNRQALGRGPRPSFDANSFYRCSSSKRRLSAATSPSSAATRASSGLALGRAASGRTGAGAGTGAAGGTAFAAG